MLGDRSRQIKERWDERATRYDQYYKTFKGAVEHYVGWELLKGYLPKNRDAKILDAAGGSGRIALPLAKMGYSVTLCDISPRMLETARQKLLKEGVLDRVNILECDIGQLRFADQSFDFALCWNGMLEAAKELIRVTKRGGTISMYLVNRCRAAIDLFSKDPASALELIESSLDEVQDDGERFRAVDPDKAKKLFEALGVTVLDIYAVCGWTDLLCIPQKLQDSRKWDKDVFVRITKMVMGLSKEPSVVGMSRHLVLYGERA